MVGTTASATGTSEPRHELTPTQVLALAYMRIDGHNVYHLFGYVPRYETEVVDDTGTICQGMGVSITAINKLETLGLVKVRRRSAYSSIGGRIDKFRRPSMTWEQNSPKTATPQ